MWWLIRDREKFYRVFSIPKAHGKRRHIQCPQKGMRFVQKSILINFLEKIPMPEHVGAYVPGRACSYTAKQHVGKKVIISMDLKDFFPSVKTSMIRKYFQDVGYNQQVSSLLASLLTYKNFVPQGASTSGYIANVIADHRFDHKIIESLKRLDPQWTYTRYSDDLDISHPEPQTQEVTKQIVRMVTEIVNRAGFKVHFKKTKREMYYQRQRVLGMVVNEKTNIPIEDYLKTRGILHDIVCYGESFDYHQDQEPSTAQAMLTHCFGKINYYKQVNPDKAAKLLRLYEAAQAALYPEGKDADICLQPSPGMQTD